MTEIIFQHGGTLDKYIGDGLMALFGAPYAGADDAINAVRAAVAMQERMRDLEETFQLEIPGKSLGIGIGINTGIACVGNMGAESRFNYSAVGDAVNTTARIESASKEVAFDILVSATVAAKLPDFALLEAGSFSLKGKSERVGLFLLLGDGKLAQTPEFRHLREAHAKLIAALAGVSAAKANILRAEAIKAANAVMPELERFYVRLGKGS